MKSKTFLYHLLFWAGIYILWVLVFRSYSFSVTKTMTIGFCYLIFITADFYIINYLLVPRLLLVKRYVLLVSATIIIIAFSAWLRALVAVQMNRYFFHLAPTDFKILFLNSIVNISIWVLLVSIVRMLVDRIQTQKKLDSLEKERLKNELDYLKAQINPHALFNSLNTIYGNIDKSNRNARDILVQFSELLRYQLYECGAEKVNLEKEILYIKNYVAFRRLQKNESLIVHIDTEDITTGLKIAPLLIIVLIENAFKFVSSSCDKENIISIRITTQENRLHCSVINTKEMQLNISNGDSGGIGIMNLKRRLELLYDRKHSLVVNNQQDFYEADLTLDLI